MSLTLRLLVAGLALVVIAACSATGGASPDGPESPGASESPAATESPVAFGYATGPRDLVLRLRHVGGFVPPSFHFSEVPVVVVYGDGTVIVPGPIPAIYPGPAMPNLQKATITPEGMQRLLAAARDAGLLGVDAHYDLGGVMDASTAEFTVIVDGITHTVSAYALNIGVDAPQGTDPNVVAARARLADFAMQLSSLEGLLAGEIGPWSAFEAESVQLLVTAGAPQDPEGLAQDPIAWPLDTPLAGFGETRHELIQGERCGVVTGEDLAALRPLFAAANTLTPWTDDGAAFGIVIRPLLPDETGCPPSV